MATTPLSVFTLQAASTVVALGVSKAYPLPTGSTPTTVLVTNMGPEPAFVNLVAAAKATTATAAKGSSTIVVADASGIAVGQNVIGAGIADGVSIPAGPISYPNGVQTTIVTDVSSTTITLSQPTTASLAGGNVAFVAALTPGTGFAVTPGATPTPLAIGSTTYLQAICPNAQGKAILNIAVGV